MNSFFALTLPSDTRDFVAALAAEWQSLLPADSDAQWYLPSDCHITLKFLGDVQTNQLQELMDAATAVAARTQPFAVMLAPVGGFPHLHKPFVLWAGVQPTEALTRLAAEVDNIMDTYGFAAERRPYRPHITLARCRISPRQTPLPTPMPNEHTFPAFQADSLVLMQTRSPPERQNGPNNRYNIVHTFPFGTTHLSPAF